MKISDISKLSGTSLQTISPEGTVHDAIQTLVKYNIGALPVCDPGGELVGIITERDILRLCAGSDCQQKLEQKVGAVMTRNLIICVPDDDIENAMHIMTEKRIRHLPILDGNKLVNIISIGDVVKAKMDESTAEIRFLRDYVTG